VQWSVKPAAIRLFKERGIGVHELQQNIVVQDGNDGLEIDLLVISNHEVIAIECKSNLSVEDVNQHIERLSKIKKLISRYEKYRILGAVAAMVIPDEVAKHAYRKGLYVIGQTGNQLTILNGATFKPKEW